MVLLDVWVLKDHHLALHNMLEVPTVLMGLSTPLCSKYLVLLCTTMVETCIANLLGLMLM